MNGSPTYLRWTSRIRIGGCLGASLAALHGIVETALAGWYGLPTSLGDVALQVGLASVGGFAGGAVVGWASKGSAAGTRRNVFTLETALYATVFWWILFSRASGWEWLIPTALVAGTGAGVSTRVLSRDATPAAATTGFLLLAIVACSAQLFDAQTAAIPDEKHGAILTVFGALAVAFTVLFLIATWPPVHERLDSTTRSWLPGAGIAEGRTTEAPPGR